MALSHLFSNTSAILCPTLMAAAPRWAVLFFSKTHTCLAGLGRMNPVLPPACPLAGHPWYGHHPLQPHPPPTAQASTPCSVRLWHKGNHPCPMAKPTLCVAKLRRRTSCPPLAWLPRGSHVIPALSLMFLHPWLKMGVECPLPQKNDYNSQSLHKPLTSANTGANTETSTNIFK